MELTTIAKPYAQAISQIASKNGDYDNWQTSLDLLALISEDELSQAFVNSPKSSDNDKVKFLTSSLSTALSRDTNSEENNLIKLLVDNNRVNIISSVAKLFNDFAITTTKNITVISAYELSDEEVNKITSDLKQKFNCEINLTTQTDSELIGGIVVKDGDKVIDLSIHASIEKLSACLDVN